MAEPLIALVSEVGMPGGGVLLLSPAVGILKGAPPPGRLISPGEPFARLVILGRAHPLLAPDGVSGVVAEVTLDGFGADAISVEYGEPILTVAPLDRAAPGEGAGPATRAAGGARGAPRREDLPAGCHAVVSPADGIFYRRPRATDPPYAEVGVRVHAGQTLALIEAMKCFSAITYGGAGFPEEAEVVEIRAEDASEVRHGQVLFVVR